jgi:hypothetical protein
MGAGSGSPEPGKASFLHAAMYLPQHRASAVLHASSFFLYTFAGTLITAAVISLFVNAAVVVNHMV